MMKQASKAVVVVVIVVWALIAHGLALLNDGVFWDGWLQWAAGRSGDWASMERWWTDSALPAADVFHHGIMASPWPFPLYRLVGFAGTLLPGLALAWIGHRAAGLGPVDSALVGALGVTHRAATMTVGLVGVLYLACIGLFSIAAVLLFASLQARLGARIVLRVVAAALLMMSFTTQSLLVLAYALPLGLALAEVRRSPSTPAWRTILVTGLRHAELVVLPPIYYFGAKKLWSTSGPVYTGYNSVDLKIETFIPLAQEYFTHGIKDAVVVGLAGLPAVLAVLLTLAVVAGALWAQGKPTEPSRGAWGIVAVVVVVLVVGTAAAFPYIAVGKVPDTQPWNWRHALVAPVAVSTFGLGLLALSRGRHFIVRLLVVVPLVVILVGQAGASIDSHALWLGRAAKDRGVIDHLKAIGKPKQVNVLWITDRLPRPHGEVYRYYEWTGMFHEAWGKFGVMGLRDTGNVNPRHVKRQKYYLNRRFQIYGGHASLAIAPTFPANELADVGLSYARRRLVGDAAAYARSLVTVSITRRDPPEAYLDVVQRLGFDPTKVRRWTPEQLAAPPLQLGPPTTKRPPRVITQPKLFGRTPPPQEPDAQDEGAGD